jgi:hypothetical protein
MWHCNTKLSVTSVEQLHNKTLRYHVREGMELAEGVVAGRGKEGKFRL